MQEIYRPLTSGEYYQSEGAIPGPGYRHQNAPLIVTNANSAERVDIASIIRHDLEGDCDLGMWLKWTFFVRPLHNTVIEDAFDKVESRFSRTVVKRSQWGPYIRFLRRLIARRRRRLEAAK